MQSRLILEKFVRWGQICVFTTQTSEKFHFAMSVTFRRSFIYSFHFSANTVKKFMKINF